MIAQLEEGTFYAELDNAQKAAIRLSLRLGREFQERFPNLAEEYRQGFSTSQLVERYNVKLTFGINQGVAEEAVRRAIVGYEGGMEIAQDVEVYRGLITDISELERIAKKHHVESGRRLGIRYGRISGRTTYRRGTGVHGMTREEKRAAGQKGIIVQGRVPWSYEELKRVYDLAQRPDYRRMSRINSKKIVQIINADFHDGQSVRTSRTVTKVFSKFKHLFEEGE